MILTNFDLIKIKIKNASISFNYEKKMNCIET